MRAPGLIVASFLIVTTMGSRGVAQMSREKGDQYGLRSSMIEIGRFLATPVNARSTPASIESRCDNAATLASELRERLSGRKGHRADRDFDIYEALNALADGLASEMDAVSNAAEEPRVREAALSCRQRISGFSIQASLL